MNRKKHVLTIVVLVAVIIATLVALSSCDLFGDSQEEEKDLKVELYSVSQSSDFAVDNEKKTVNFAVSVTSEKFSLSRISFRNNSEIVFKAYSDKELTKEIEKEITLSEGENVFYIQAWHKDAPSEKVTYTVTVTKPVAHVHAFGQWTVVTEATCTENGLQERVCECGEKESEVVEAKGHTYGKWTTTVEPTCADGEKERVCSVCGHVETEIIEAVSEHTFGEWTVETSATCTEAGRETRVCGVCGEEEFRSVDALGHDYDEGQVTTEATCTEDGVKTFTCQRDGCGDTYTEVIPAKGHTFIDGVCEICGTELNYTEGLSYELNEEGTGYTVTGIGTATDTDIVIPSEYNGLPVTSIGDLAFSYCRSLTSIVIPDSVTSIGDSAFFYCDSLISVVIPDGVTSIGFGAFRACTSLTNVTIGNGVTSIGDWAFDFCTSLTSITVDENNTAYASIDGNLYNKDKTTLIQYAIGKTATEFTIPDSVTSIGDSAFFYCDSLISVVIPDSVTSIGYGAFTFCDSLTSVTIGNGVTSIGNAAFHSCTSLTSVTIGNGVTSIGDSTFYYCDSLISVVIPDGVTSIGDNAFDFCTSLTDVYYGGTEEQWNDISIGIGNEDLMTANIHFSADPDDGQDPDDEQEPSEPVLIPTEGLSYELNEDGNGYTVTGIGTAKDTDIMIPSEYKGLPVTGIGDWAFDGCSSLTSIEIPSSVTSIGDGAFQDCSSLTSVTFGDNSQLTSIGQIAFGMCSSLTSVVIPGSVTSIGMAAFAICTSLTNIAVDKDNAYYISVDGNLYNKDKTTFMQYAAGKTETEFVIPDSVTSIGDGAFTYCSSLTSIEIPNTVTSIGNGAFAYCSSLTRVSIPDSVEYIGYNVFEECGSLQYNEYDNAYYLGNENNLYFALIKAKNENIASCIINANTKIIAGDAFSGCTLLESIEIPSSVTSIGEMAFEYCSSLTSIEIPSSVTSIGEMAFYGCDSLTSIEIPSSVTSICDYAFYGCDSLTSIEIPSSVTSIGDWAFFGCTLLTDVYYGGTEEQWNGILIGYDNIYLTSANIHFSAADGTQAA